MDSGCRIRVSGAVQGVGFRPFVYRAAHAEGVRGRVHNDTAGVTIEAFGSEPALRRFVARLESEAPPAAAIREIQCTEIPAEPTAGFAIVASQSSAEHRVSIPPDLATCDACLRELRAPADRRFGYAFTNCTHCGPRFSIARAIPYDRATTTMAAFELCPDCRAEYETPSNRRFHAEPNACPACGPRLRLWRDAAEVPSCDPVADAAAALGAGEIVAIKGIGGYHLAVDATSEPAVARLRARKRRDEKPFAVMVADLEAAERLAELGAPERALITSLARPIVLAPRRVPTPVAEAVAPRNPLLGLLLPYTPLHHLLLERVARPLVMTSANLSDEPLVYRDDEARERLRGLADLWLVHDREIVTRCDDSVARVVAGVPTLLRRSRGYVPAPLRVSVPFRRPVLACGAHLKNTCCLGVGELAYLGPHVGDLEDESACDAFDEVVARLERFVDVRPEIVAHDLHPDYYSTRYARRREGVERIAVQHHHAHVVSAMAEHGLTAPVIGVAYDGTGYGTDGTLWGGEILRADAAGYERLATLRPLALPGGERAVRDVWRAALSLLDDAFDGAPPAAALARFEGIDPAELTVVRQARRRGLNAPLARGVGRYFDAVGAFVLGRRSARYEGQVAMALEFAARYDAPAYPYAIARQAAPVTLDLRPMARAIVADVLAGVDAGNIASRFHETLAVATVELVRDALAERGLHTVVLSGGCFQNARLAARIRAGLAGFDVRQHRQVPPGDGGIALGQALVANAQAGRD